MGVARSVTGLGVVMATLALAPAATAEPRSTFTPLQGCPKAGKAAPADPVATLCAGVAPYQVIVTGDDVRSWIELRWNGLSYSMQRDMNSAAAPGHFPTVEKTKVIEWRSDGAGGRPYALIARYAFQDRDNVDKARSALAVYDLAGGAPVFLGFHASNEAAQKAADTARR